MPAPKSQRSRKDPPYARLEPRYWDRARQRRWTNDASLLGVYLRSNTSTRSEGLYLLRVDRMLADLPKGWNRSRIRKAPAELEREGFAVYDEDAGVVFLPTAMLIQKTANLNVRKNAVGYYVTLPATPLWRYFVEAAARYDPELCECLKESFPERLGATEWGWEDDDQPFQQRMQQLLSQPQALDSRSNSDSVSDSNPTSDPLSRSHSSGTDSDTQAQSPVLADDGSRAAEDPPPRSESTGQPSPLATKANTADWDAVPADVRDSGVLR